MTPAEASQERRDAAIKRGRRIEQLASALDGGQLANFIHRLAAIEPAVVDRVLAEFDANAPKPRAEKLLHPVEFVSNASNLRPVLLAICELCQWRTILEDRHGLADLERLVREHSGIES